MFGGDQNCVDGEQQMREFGTPKPPIRVAAPLGPAAASQLLPSALGEMSTAVAERQSSTAITIAAELFGDINGQELEAAALSD